MWVNMHMHLPSESTGLLVIQKKMNITLCDSEAPKVISQSQETKPFGGMTGCRPGQRKYGMRSKHLVVPEHKKILKTKSAYNEKTDDRVPKGHRSMPETACYHQSMAVVSTRQIIR